MQTAFFPSCVIFDLDGTLVDTAPDLTAATNHVLALMDRPPVTVAQVKDMVGLGARKLIERGLETTGGGTPDQVEALVPAFLDFYAKNICIHSHPFPGATESLDQLVTAGIPLGICTNKPEQLSLALIDALGWTPYFRANLGGDSLGVRKPDPLHLLETISRTGGHPKQAIMVGDSSVDIAAARAAGVPIIAVSFGFSSVAPSDLGADYLIDHFDELTNALAQLSQKQQ